MSARCPIGPLNLHTMNYERDECIWCGPNGLAWKDGKWVDIGNGSNAWSVEHTSVCTPCAESTRCDLCDERMCDLNGPAPSPGCGARCVDCPPCDCTPCGDARDDLAMEAAVVAERDARWSA